MVISLKMPLRYFLSSMAMVSMTRTTFIIYVSNLSRGILKSFDGPDRFEPFLPWVRRLGN